jgi:geranylgeranyl pyrophosphate synthase
MSLGALAQGAGDEICVALARYSRALGVAYQILNDLKDLSADEADKVLAGQDVQALRPSLLLSFALEGTTEAEGRALVAMLRSGAPAQERLERLREIYEARGVIRKAERLIEKYRRRAAAAAAGVEPPALARLMEFIVDVVLS